MYKHKVQCDDCGATWTEVYESESESHSDPADPKPCNCMSQYTFVDETPPCKPMRTAKKRSLK